MFVAPPKKGKIYCFGDEDRATYLRVKPQPDDSGRVAEIFISSFPNCNGFPLHKAEIKRDSWRTPEGIQIDSSSEEVLHAYGDPTVKAKIDDAFANDLVASLQDRKGIEARMGDVSYLYNCTPPQAKACYSDNRATQIGFKDGKVVWIDISNTE